MKSNRAFRWAIVFMALWLAAPRAHAGFAFTTLHAFSGVADGAQPFGGLVIGNDGNFYGTTLAGGLYATGTVFKITPGGAFTNLYSFQGSDGASPYSGLALGIDGNFYGTTFGGGANGYGTLFKVLPTGALTTIYTFQGGSDGSGPIGALALGADSNFYGTAYSGGNDGNGTIFQITPGGVFTLLHTFTGDTDGGSPIGALALGTDGNLYGTTYAGGENGTGTVFQVTPGGAFTTLYAFTGGNDGAAPAGGLALGSDSNFYGTASLGGKYGFGNVFKITPGGSLTVLHSFTNGGDGANPESTLLLGADGNFYGTAYSGGADGNGTIFQITTGGVFTLLHTFTGNDGAEPIGVMAQGSNGILYGTTSSGGNHSQGTVFQITPVVATPTITPDGGKFTNSVLVTINCASAGATIAYTTDGSNPTTNSTVYEGPFTLTGSSTVKAIGFASGFANSSVASAGFTVLPSTFLALLGTYNGLILQTNAPSQASSGSIKLVLTVTGSFSATLTMGGAHSTFKGTFDSNGDSTNTVVLVKPASSQVILHLDLTNGTEEITGIVSNGTFQSELLADRAVFGKTLACPLAGQYTMVLEPPAGNDPSVPQGYGFGTLTITTTGSGKLAGLLGDGTTLKASVPISKFGTGPLYSSLYKNQGSCIGWLTFASNDTLAATVNWFKPAMPKTVLFPSGFAIAESLIGSKYVPPPAGETLLDLANSAGNVLLTFEDGNLGTTLSNLVTVATDNTVTVLAGDVAGLKLKVTPKTGTLGGSFVYPPTGKSAKFQGVVLQSQDFGVGCFLGTNESGSVTFEPVP